MKKFLTLILAVLLIASLSVTAFATDTPNSYISADDKATDATETINWTDTTVSDTGDVVIEMTGDVPTNDVYQVLVTWKDMTFSYSYAAGVVWSPSEHEYIPTSGNNVGCWTADNGATKDDDAGTSATMASAITVVNHSNKDVKVKAGFNNAAATNMTTNGVTAYVVESSVTDYTNATVTEQIIDDAEGKVYDEAASATYKVNVSGTPTVSTGFTVGTVTLTISKTDVTTTQTN